MPKTKAKTKAAGEEKTKIKKSATKPKSPAKKKARPVVIDVIEDEKIIPSGGSNFFADLEIPEKLSHRAEEEVSVAAADDLDQQKKFFSELASETKSQNSDLKANSETTSRVNGKSVSLYRRLVWKFVVLVLILAGIVAYFSFSKLTIVITPKGESLNDTLFLKVVKAGATAEVDDPRETISGTIKEIDANVEQSYAATGEEFTGEEISGRVKIINNYTKNQPLVAKTRILSPDNKLFRIKNAVDVPAGGEVEVEIYADKPAEDLAIGPTTFTIPGLWLGLQDKIIAKSDTEFVFQKKVKKYVKQTDLEEASKDINNLLVKTAKGQTPTDGDWLYDTSEVVRVVLGAKAGEAKDEFTAQATGTIVAVSFSKDQIKKLAAAKLNLLVPDDKELVEFKPENIGYTLDSYDAKTGLATIKATFSGTMALKSDSEIIDRRQLVNLTKEQIDNYLKAIPEIKNYALKFSPAFIKKAPSLVDRITVKIDK